MPGTQAQDRAQGPDRGRSRLRAAARLAVLAALLLLAGMACAWAAEPQGEELLAVVPVGMTPMYSTDADGRPAGFAVDVMRRVAARAGYRLRFVTTEDLGQAMAVLAQGRAQVLPGLVTSPERTKRFAFTRTFETLPVHIYFRAQGPPRENLAALAGLRVTLVADTIPLERLGHDPSFSVREAETLSQALFDLFSGDTDALIFQAPRLEALARAAGVESRLGRSRLPIFEVNRALAVDPSRPELLKRLDASLDAFCDTQEFRDLYREWHPDPVPPLLNPAAKWIIAGIALGLCGVFLAWRTISLARVNRRLLAALSERDQAMAALRLSQDRMEALSTLAQMDGANLKALSEFALKEGVRLTGSGLGFLMYPKSDTVDFDHVFWSLGDFQCAVPGEARIYPLAEAGLWADCVRRKAPVVVNDYAGAPGVRLPEGHAPILRFMAVPLAEGGSVPAVICVANKPTPYDANDTRQLQLFLAGLWRVLAARQAAESIRRGRDYAESLIEGANAMLVGLDRQGRVSLFNTAAEAISGYKREEVMGREWFAAMLPEALAERGTALYREFMSGQTSLPKAQEGPLRTRDGRLRRIAWQSSLLTENGTITGVLAYGIDITEKKEAEAELRRLHRAIEQAAEGVLIADDAGRVLYANPALERMLGQGAGGPLVRGASVFDLNLSVLDHHSSFTRDEGCEGVWRGTCVFSRAETGPVEVEFAVSAVRDGAEPPVSYSAVCRDVTEKRLLEHQLWQAQKMEALGTLAGGVAHDFNNLLASIMGFAELARDEAPDGSRGRTYLARVLNACTRARELVRQILSFSRRNEQRLRPVDADGAVAESLRLLEASVPKNITLESSIASGAVVLADPSQLHQIVMNLCANAVHAMREAGGVLCVRTSCGPLPAEISARRRLPPGDYLALTVEDQGPGIPQDALGRIFDPFFTTKGPGEGTGLGLAVVHGIVAGLGGTVWAESEPGQGARFTVLLPTQPGQAVQPGREAPSEPVSALRGCERILLVDDEPDIQELGRQTLLPLGYQVSAEGDPEAALDRLLSEPESFDLLLTDMNMPHLSGLSLAERLREEHADLPIVFLTGLSLKLPLGRLESLSPAWLLNKPFSTGELAQTVRQALDAGKETGHGPACG